MIRWAENYRTRVYSIRRNNMGKAGSPIKQIFVYADWIELAGARFMGILQAEQVRGKEVFSFSYHKEWLQSAPALLLDPDLGFFSGPQYNREEKPNFGLFTDSAPDRWGRVLMERREAFTARQERRRARSLMESDYLMGVFDADDFPSHPRRSQPATGKR